MGENRNRQEWAYFLFGVWVLCVGRGGVDGGIGSVKNVNGFFWIGFFGWYNSRKAKPCSAKVVRFQRPTRSSHEMHEKNANQRFARKSIDFVQLRPSAFSVQPASGEITRHLEDTTFFGLIYGSKIPGDNSRLSHSDHIVNT